MNKKASTPTRRLAVAAAAVAAAGKPSKRSKRWRIPDPKELNVIMDWVTQQLRYNSVVPRVSDVIDYARKIASNLKRGDIAKALRLHPAYVMNSSQQRMARRARKYRPVVTNSLGYLHCDLGFFATVRDYETPKMYRSGFLVAKDILSRYTYAIILKGSKDTKSIIRAFGELMRQHVQHTGGQNVVGISFDKETAVMSRQVQQFLRDNNVDFHAFSLTASKSKFAEGAIRLIRTEMKRLQRASTSPSTFRWWNYLQIVVDNLNSKPIIVDGKNLKFTPADVNVETLPQFIKALHKAAPAYYFSQFDIAPQVVQFKYPVGTLVRPKLIITSSEVIGVKHSETNLEQDVFEIVAHRPYVTRLLTVGKAYKCQNIKDPKHFEVFDEQDLAETIVI